MVCFRGVGVCLIRYLGPGCTSIRSWFGLALGYTQREHMVAGICILETRTHIARRGTGGCNDMLAYNENAAKPASRSLDSFTLQSRQISYHAEAIHAWLDVIVLLGKPTGVAEKHSQPLIASLH